MARIDLHAHTNRSDGSLEPGALVRAAAEAGLRLLAVTDHDTTSALDEAEEAGRALGVEVLAGVEVTARFPGRAMHVLGWGFDRREPRLVEMLGEIRGVRASRNPRIVARLVELGYPVTMEEVLAEAGPRATVGRPHIARALVRRGHAPDTRTAFALWLRDGGPAYVPAESVEPAEVIAAIRAAGGTTAVAHPRQLRVESPLAYEALFADLARAGLGGIEVHHPSHKAEERALFGRIAEANRLVVTGGSDFHGEGKPDIRLGVGDGTIDVPYETWEALRARCAA